MRYLWNLSLMIYVTRSIFLKHLVNIFLILLLFMLYFWFFPTPTLLFVPFLIPVLLLLVVSHSLLTLSSLKFLLRRRILNLVVLRFHSLLTQKKGKS